MDWKTEAIKDLKSYPQRKEAIKNLKARIKILEDKFISLKGISIEEPVRGGMSRQEERWIDNIAERERLEMSLNIAQEMVDLTERGLEVLDERERQVIDGLYIEPSGAGVDFLCDSLNMAKSSLYRLKDEALRKFTLAEYGTVEI